MTFKFYYTENGIEKEYSSAYTRVDVIEKADTNWGIAFATMDINGKKPEFEPGLWTSKVYIDGEKIGEIEFNIIDYDDISSQISQISETVQDIVDERDQLVEEYSDLVETYENLETEYEALETSSVSQSQLDLIQRDYRDLEDEYDSLRSSQASTKTMMYASIVVALVAVIIAVYFGVMKK